jgi:hypothetical protein
MEVYITQIVIFFNVISVRMSKKKRKNHYEEI